MRLVFLGPPGSGKGTQAKVLAEELKMPHISLGDILREEVRKRSEIGKRIKEVIEAGNLVPDEITNKLTEERIREEDCRDGFILDGFPRNMVQAQALEKMLEEGEIDLNQVIYFHVTENQAVERLSGRRSCKKCGAVYHLKFNPPKAEGRCDLCEGELYQREDDEESAIRRRFEVYEKQTRPLIEHYRQAQKLVNLDAGDKIDKVFADLLTLIGYGNKN